MNPELQLLQPYPFERLATLLKDVTPADVERISLSVGEPMHSAPEVALSALVENLKGVENYPPTRGSDALRESMAQWLTARYELSQAISPQTQVIPINGTREGLFAIAQCVLDRQSNRRLVLMPNPFYQIYEGAAFLAGLQPEFYNATGSQGGAPDLHNIPDSIWQSCQMIYICNPGNPTGSTLSQQAFENLINLADQHNFVIVSDECYSEIYRETAGAPIGLLQAASATGNTSYRNCLAFHSLSKRSNLPGLRSGLVAGDANLIKRFLTYRTYHGCSMAPPTQAASIAAWSDEQHVIENRRLYDKKYASVVDTLAPVLSLDIPAAGFYLWPELPVDDETFTRDMLTQHNVAVVPGSYLAREIDGYNPGAGRARLALVAPLDNCMVAAERIRDYLQSQT